MAMNTDRQLGVNSDNNAKSIEKLSSGLRINRAGDDAAGLAISEKMRGQIRGLNQGSRNAQDGISMIQTGEGALNETHDILQRVRELAVQSGNDTNTDNDRKEIQKEVNQLTDEVDRIATTTEFNTKTLMTGTLKGIAASTTSTFTEKESNAAIGFTSIGASVTGTYTVTDTVRIRAVGVGSVTGSTGSIAGTMTFSVSNALGAITAAAVGSLGSVTIGTVVVGTITAGNVNAGDTMTFSIDAAEDAVTTDNAVRFQIGANTAQEIAVGMADMRSTALGIKTGTTYLDVSTQLVRKLPLLVLIQP
jgi:flagellin